VTESGNPRSGRRRRTRRHRRNRLIRRSLAIAAIAVTVAGASALVLNYISPSLFRVQGSTPPTFQQTELSRERVIQLNELLAHAPSPDRPVYPYSVVPGGVDDAKELKWVAEHDPVVASHYAGFDYEHARVVRLTLAETVFMSYRIGNHIYWTRHRLKLHKGERVLTDGRIVLRARCGNRVEKVPQQAASPNEPPAVRFDEPVGTGMGTAMQAPPVPFQSALLGHAPSIGSMGPLALYDPLGGGSWVPISPPPVPAGLCGPHKKNEIGTGCCPGVGEEGKKKGGPCGTTGVVPEPGTWILFASGLIFIYWQARRKLAIG
jgi:hypothetical protein